MPRTYKQQRKVLVPSLGDLDTPVVFFKSTRIPNTTTGFTQRLDRYSSEWACFDEGTYSWLNGVQCEPFAGAKFTVYNNDERKVQLDDRIITGNRVFRIVHTKILDKERRLFLKITCQEEPNLASPEMSNEDVVLIEENPDPPARVETPRPENGDTEYWGIINVG